MARHVQSRMHLGSNKEEGIQPRNQTWEIDIRSSGKNRRLIKLIVQWRILMK